MNTSDQINDLMAKGIEIFKRKKYDEAIEAFKEAYNLANNQEI